MASSSKKKSKSKAGSNSASESEVVDAVVIEETDGATEAAMETIDEMADADGVSSGDAELSEDDSELVEEDLSSMSDGDAQSDDIADVVDEDALEDAGSEAVVEDVVEEIAPVPAEVETIRRSGGFFPMLCGGVLAAGIGYFFAQYLEMNGSNDLEATVAAQSEVIEGQTQTIEGLSAQIAQASAETENLNATAGNLAAEMTAQAEQIAALEAQIVELSKPVPIASEAELSADLAALIAAQKEELAALQDDLKSMAEFAEGQIQSAQEEADAAARAEAKAKARDAMNKVRLALASGDAFEDALPEIAGAVEVPAALSDVASGVSTQSDLQSSFGAAARSALAASNRELAGDSASDRVGLFFQDMIGARSLSPQEGDSPDAVLSRAEAAVQNGDLAAAMTEIEALPEAGRAELTEWSEKAAARNDALQAFSDLTDALSAD